MIGLAARTFRDRWQLFAGSLLATALGVAIVHAGMTVVLGVEGAQPPSGSSRAAAEAFRQAASGAGTLTGMTVMLAAFLTVFVVSSTIGFAVDERRPDLAALRLAGVTGRQVRVVLLVEAHLVAASGALVGALAGVALTLMQVAALRRLGAFPAGLVVSQRPAVLVLDVVLAAAVCLLGGWGAARRGTRVSPLDAQRRGGADEHAMTIGRWVLGAVAAVATAGLTWWGATSGGMLLALLLGLGVVVTASVALSRLSPLLVPAVATLLTPIARRSPVASLAVAGMRDGVRRAASCAAPMIVLVSLVMGLQGILDTQTAAASAESSRLVRADLVATGSRVDVPRLAAVPGVHLVAPETTVPVGLRLTAGATSTPGGGTVVAVDPVAFRATHLQHPAAGSLAAFGRRSLVLGPGLDSTTVARHYDSISLTVDGRRIPLTEAARMGETLAGQDGYYIDRAVVPPRLLEGPTRVLVQAVPGVDLASVASGLRRAGMSDVTTLEQASHADDAVKDRENRGVMTAIVGLGSAYALITVLSTAAIATSQRRREMAALRLTGLTRWQIVAATVTESAGAVLVGLLLGAVAAVLALVGLWLATARTYGAPVVVIPWGLLLGLAAVGLTLTAVTTGLTALRVMRGAPVAALGARE